MTRADKGTRYYERKLAMLRAGVTGAAVARELGVNPAMVTHTLQGKMLWRGSSQRIMGRLADKLGTTVAKLFPEEFNLCGRCQGTGKAANGRYCVLCKGLGGRRRLD